MTKCHLNNKIKWLIILVSAVVIGSSFTEDAEAGNPQYEPARFFYTGGSGQHSTAKQLLDTELGMDAPEPTTQTFVQYVDRPVPVYISKTVEVANEVPVEIPVVKEWQLGDDIEPMPVALGNYNCRQSTYFTYLFLEYQQRGYDIDIYEGWVKNIFGEAEYHLWIEASDNISTWVYTDGLALPGGYFDGMGREITVKKLVSWVMQNS